MPTLKDLFLLDPEVVFLNHGSFGATPRPVFEAYQEWQRRLERQPVQFLAAELGEHLTNARQALAKELHTRAENLVFIPNATYGVNLIARSLPLRPADEVLASDHEYGACNKTWDFNCRKTGATYRRQAISLPASSQEEMVEALWQGVSRNTRLIFLSHITSPTAARLPVEQVCRRARQAGILTLIDGAHAPGQIPVDLEAIGADFYAGNCHKWLCAPKGSGFLYARPEVQDLVEPLVVSWGWGEESTLNMGSAFLDSLQWPGTFEPSAYLSVPTAIHFQAEYDWPAVRESCHLLLLQALERICELTGLPSLYPEPVTDHGNSLPPQMGAARLPAIEDLEALKAQLYRDYRIEVPCTLWNDWQLVRISIQGYNTQPDVDALVGALKDMIPLHLEKRSG